MTLGTHHDLTVQISRYIPAGLLDRPGEVLMSGLDTLSKATNVSIMGYNPGGDGLPSISEQLGGYLTSKKTQHSYSAYVDQCWHKGFWPNQICPTCIASGAILPDRHQKGVREMADIVGFDLRKALSINAIFCQTTTVKAFLFDSLKEKKSGWHIFNEYFWPVHRWLLKDVTCTKLLICLGNADGDSSFSYIAKSLGVEKNGIHSLGPTYGFGKYFHDGEMLIIGIPHPSRFGLHKNVRELLETVARPHL